MRVGSIAGVYFKNTPQRKMYTPGKCMTLLHQSHVTRGYRPIVSRFVRHG